MASALFKDGVSSFVIVATEYCKDETLDGLFWAMSLEHFRILRQWLNQKTTKNVKLKERLDLKERRGKEIGRTRE